MIRSIAPILRLMGLRKIVYLMGLQFTRWQMHCCDVTAPHYAEYVLRANRLERDGA